MHCLRHCHTLNIARRGDVATPRAGLIAFTLEGILSPFHLTLYRDTLSEEVDLYNYQGIADS